MGHNTDMNVKSPSAPIRRYWVQILVRETGYSESPQSFQANAGIVPKSKPWQIPSRSFPIHNLHNHPTIQYNIT
jgi:hypothetical protein